MPPDSDPRVLRELLKYIQRAKEKVDSGDFKSLIAVAFFGDKIHGAKFFNIEFRGVKFLLKMKTLKINTIKLVYSLSRGGIFRLNLDRDISQ